jgi:hypothetical protein
MDMMREVMEFPSMEAYAMKSDKDSKIKARIEKQIVVETMSAVNE